jgi:hypothetical protein
MMTTATTMATETPITVPRDPAMAATGRAGFCDGEEACCWILDPVVLPAEEVDGDVCGEAVVEELDSNPVVPGPGVRVWLKDP